ncbi:MEDS domain-containing protein [Streptomyces sp. MJP52]|uniref:MEDS domain-containing protein n=1 Tax=Streptomyces sp. MJP52 TaxID=2940555 RepID=UPI00247712AC|nr:MEDS domain-containing protein [Streptomyces sp. MJP52]MDH6227223.1 ABC-type transporter Mla MlaB component [Streptomyces sp. MJP52]
MAMTSTSAVPAPTAPEPCGHVSVVYSDDREWAGRLVPFVRAGLERGEQVQYFADTTDPDRVMGTLASAGVDAGRAAAEGRLVVTTAARTYLSGPAFDPDAMMGLWHQAMDTALAEGHRGLRAIGEVAWGARDLPGADRLLEYELRLHHEVFEPLPLTAWCFYDRRRMPADRLAVLIGAHLNHLGGPVADPPLRLAPLPGRTGLRLTGSAGYDTRYAMRSAAAVVSRSPGGDVELDLSGLRHLDVSSLAVLAEAARRRDRGGLRLLRPPEPLRRLLGLFPELGAALEIAGP